MILVLGEWRSLVARLLWEQDAAGSNPVSPMRSKTSPQLVFQPSHKGRFFMACEHLCQNVAKNPHRFRWFGTTSQTVVDRDEHLQETWPTDERESAGHAIGTSFLAVKSLLGLFRFTFSSEPSVLPVGGLMASVL